ncbi:MAG: hypothetical protein ACYC6B_03815 [Thermoleophilia bacterium]
MNTWNKTREDSGVAMISVIMISAVLMVLSVGMFFLASREQTMTQADYAGNESFYFAEGGIDNVIDIFNYQVSVSQLILNRPDQSSNGYGYLMDPSPGNRETPTDPLQVNVLGTPYTVWVDTVDVNGNHCTDCGVNLALPASTAYLKVTAEARSDIGYRKLQQMVKVSASSEYPLSFYVDGDVDLNGNPDIVNQILYVKGNVTGRSKLNITGTDVATGKPAGVYATGTIDARQANDRDHWGPAGNTFTMAELQNSVNLGGLSSSTLASLKQQAQDQGNYYTTGSFGTVKGDSAGNAVLYLDCTDRCTVDPKFTWPAPGYVLIIVKNGDVTLTGDAIGSSRALIYCPDGSIRADGGGSGEYSGLVWSKGFSSIGNFQITLDPSFLSDNPPFFLWQVARLTNWTEVEDR